MAVSCVPEFKKQIENIAPSPASAYLPRHAIY